MLRRVVIILTLVFTISFLVSRLDSSRSISSEYMLLSKIEEQNMNQLLRAIKYNISSFSQMGQYINSKPKDGVVIIDTATDDYEFLKNDLMEFNNNYMFPMALEYKNSDKELYIRCLADISDDLLLQDYKIIKDGEEKVVKVVTTPQ